MTHLSFTLSMPGVNSWNRKWSGAGKPYVLIRNFGRSKDSRAAAERMLAKGYYTYAFGDGWVAAVTVAEVTAAEARSLRRQSAGFCGYDWMVDSIVERDAIEAAP